MIKTIEKFGAEWCGPCKVLDANLEGISGVEVVKYDADRDEELFVTRGVRNVPTMFFKDEDGNVVERIAGLRSMAEIREIIEKHAGTRASGIAELVRQDT